MAGLVDTEAVFIFNQKVKGKRTGEDLTLADPRCLVPTPGVKGGWLTEPPNSVTQSSIKTILAVGTYGPEGP